MLGKLLKHDFISIGRKTVPVYIALLITSLVGKLFVFLSSRKSYVDSTSSGFYRIAKGFSSLFEVLYTILIFVALIGTILFIVYRFYQSIYTDEGYLTLTLPVKSHQIIGSKLISAFIWSVITGAVVILSSFILLRTEETGNKFDELKEAFMDMIKRISDGMDISHQALITELVFLIIIVIITQYLMFYTTITFGCTYAKKSKLLGIIISFVIIYAIIRLLGFGVLHFLTDYLPGQITDLSSDTFKASQATIITVMVTNIIYSLIFFFTSGHLIKSKVNLD